MVFLRAAGVQAGRWLMCLYVARDVDAWRRRAYS
jgi:hypothetical protein